MAILYTFVRPQTPTDPPTFYRKILKAKWSIVAKSLFKQDCTFKCTFERRINQYHDVPSSSVLLMPHGAFGPFLLMLDCRGPADCALLIDTADRLKQQALPLSFSSIRYRATAEFPPITLIATSYSVQQRLYRLPRGTDIDDRIPEALQREHDACSKIETKLDGLRVDQSIDSIDGRRDPGDAECNKEEEGDTAIVDRCTISTRHDSVPLSHGGVASRERQGAREVHVRPSRATGYLV